MVNKYRIVGKFGESQIDLNIDAYSPKQAKFKAGLGLGLNGQKLREFLKSPKIKVIRK